MVPSWLPGVQNPPDCTIVKTAAVAKFAVTAFAASIVTVHPPVPLHGPDHPVKMLDADAVAVSVTTVPTVNV
jgi:hypothetical protein